MHEAFKGELTSKFNFHVTCDGVQQKFAPCVCIFKTSTTLSEYRMKNSVSSSVCLCRFSLPMQVLNPKFCHETRVMNKGAQIRLKSFCLSTRSAHSFSTPLPLSRPLCFIAWMKLLHHYYLFIVMIALYCSRRYSQRFIEIHRR